MIFFFCFCSPKLYWIGGNSLKQFWDYTFFVMQICGCGICWSCHMSLIQYLLCHLSRCNFITNLCLAYYCWVLYILLYFQAQSCLLRGWSRLTPACQHLFAPCVRWMVRQGDQAEIKRTMFSDSFCWWFCYRLRTQSGCLGSNGCSTEMIRPIQVDHTPWQNRTRRFSSTESKEWEESPDHIWFPRIHALLGKIKKRQMGDQTQDRKKETQASDESRMALVSWQPTSQSLWATPYITLKVAGSLSILWHTRQL